MRKLMLSTMLFVAAVPACGQSSASNWQRVASLPPGTTVRVHTTTRNVNCRIASATDETLTCGNNSTVLQRAEIRSVREGARGTSAATGFAIGAGAGIVTGYAITAPGNNDFGLRSVVAAVTGILGGIVGGLIGLGTDFLGKTIYKQ